GGARAAGSRGGNAAAPPGASLVLSLDDGSTLEFRDLQLSRFALLRAGAKDADQPEAIEPLAPTTTLQVFRRALGQTGRIKAALSDQDRIAGIGNLWAHEILFEAGLRPDRPASGLSVTEMRALYRKTRQVLRNAVEAGGEPDFQDVFGQRGRYRLMVYGRAGQACRACGARIRGGRLGGAQPPPQRTHGYGGRRRDGGALQSQPPGGPPLRPRGLRYEMRPGGDGGSRGGARARGPPPPRGRRPHVCRRRGAREPRHGGDRPDPAGGCRDRDGADPAAHLHRAQRVRLGDAADHRAGGPRQRPRRRDRRDRAHGPGSLGARAVRSGGPGPAFPSAAPPSPEYVGQAAWFDAALLAEAGIPAVIFGPSGAGWHAAVEYADLPSVAACAQVLAQVILDFCGTAPA